MKWLACSDIAMGAVHPKDKILLLIRAAAWMGQSLVIYISIM